VDLLKLHVDDRYRKTRENPEEACQDGGYVHFGRDECAEGAVRGHQGVRSTTTFIRCLLPDERKDRGVSPPPTGDRWVSEVHAKRYAFGALWVGGDGKSIDYRFDI